MLLLLLLLSTGGVDCALWAREKMFSHAKTREGSRHDSILDAGFVGRRDIKTRGHRLPFDNRRRREAQAPKTTLRTTT
jgi:hypothetical protein